MFIRKRLISLLICSLLIITSASVVFASDIVSGIKVKLGDNKTPENEQTEGVKSIIIKGEENFKKLADRGIIRSYNYTSPEKDQGVQTIIIKGEEIIKALEGRRLRGYKKDSPENISVLSDDEVSPYGTSIPTKTWDLQKGGRSFTYSFKSYLYSDYNYIPYDDGIAPSICITIDKPETSHNLKMQLIESGTNKVVAEFEEYIDDGYRWMIDNLSRSKKYYIKFISPDNKQIRGSGGVA
ncbi:hypothetical protein [Thermoanaerobacterium sp. DL9XJH110]|uniref:hypothetical protein n=1 Tax=Thermoanaerobacterium sp. DL9XJH110 TaxID=3386643 RepID=UPI003BB7CE12